MSKHTPGPWKASGFALLSLGGTNEYEATTIWAEADRVDVGYAAATASEADARLMAAAPELLAALERVMQRAHACACSECEQAHAAIRKAKGEA